MAGCRSARMMAVNVLKFYSVHNQSRPEQSTRSKRVGSVNESWDCNICFFIAAWHRNVMDTEAARQMKTVEFQKGNFYSILKTSVARAR